MSLAAINQAQEGIRLNTSCKHKTLYRKGSFTTPGSDSVFLLTNGESRHYTGCLYAELFNQETPCGAVQSC